MAVASLLPTREELVGLVDYLMTNPDLFIHSTTVITSVIVAAAIGLRILVVAARLVAVLSDRVLRLVAPTVALVLLYFGIGAMALSTEILVRFHDTIPATTEEQFRSGIGHLAIGLIGVIALLPWLRRRSRGEWLGANVAALAYWTFQVVVLTPPWFAFQGQRALVLAVVAALLALSATGTLLVIVRAVRSSRRPPAVLESPVAADRAA